MARTKKQINWGAVAPVPIYPLTVQLDKDAVIRGLNEVSFVGGIAVVHDLLLAGQHSRDQLTEETPEGQDAIRALVVYREPETNTLGVLWLDFTYTLLREMQEIGGQK